MKQAITKFFLFLVAGIFMILSSCSKSSSSNSGGGGGSGTNPSTPIFPLAVNNSWNYKLKLYNTSTGAVTDSSNFTVTITGTFSANGNTYYQFQNSVDTTTIGALAAINNTTLGSIDSAYGINFYTFFVEGTGDSTASVSSWPVSISASGTTCEGTNKLYAYYADTTLINEDGIVYANSYKNVIETYNCSGNKLLANVYFVKQGYGIVRYVQYIYGATGELELQLAWVLESESLQ
jgi:hypothetical protein